MASARTLQDITDERVVPVDYLGVLILLFLLLVLDRLFYSLGLHLGKVRLSQLPCMRADAWQWAVLHAAWPSYLLREESCDQEVVPRGRASLLATIDHDCMTKRLQAMRMLAASFNC